MPRSTLSLSDSILFESWGETAAHALTVAFTRRGFRVVRSFDLRSALAGQADCDCPYHGTARCTCQFAALLVYCETGAPVVVTFWCAYRIVALGLNQAQLVSLAAFAIGLPWLLHLLRRNGAVRAVIQH